MPSIKVMLFNVISSPSSKRYEPLATSPTGHRRVPSVITTRPSASAAATTTKSISWHSTRRKWILVFFIIVVSLGLVAVNDKERVQQGWNELLELQHQRTVAQRIAETLLSGGTKLSGEVDGQEHDHRLRLKQGDEHRSGKSGVHSGQMSGGIKGQDGSTATSTDDQELITNDDAETETEEPLFETQNEQASEDELPSIDLEEDMNADEDPDALDLILTNSPTLPVDPLLVLPSKRIEPLSIGQWKKIKPIPNQPANQNLKPGEEEKFTQLDALVHYNLEAKATQESGGSKRALRVASYAWVPNDEQALVEWDGYEVAKRLLNAPMGLLIIGDSVSNLESLSFRQMMGVSKVAPHRDQPWDGNVFRYSACCSPKMHSQLTLNPRSRWFGRLRKELSHLPMERLTAPLIQYRRSDGLIDSELLLELAAKRGLELGLGAKEWVNTTWMPALPRRDVPPRKIWPGMQNDVLLLSTGAHWSTDAMEIKTEEIIDLSRDAAASLIEDLISRPNLDIIFRSVSPAQPNCTNYRDPVPTPMPLEEHPEHPGWSWEIFDRISRVWSEEMDRLAPAGLAKDGRSRVVFLDVMPMARMRPDGYKIKRPTSPDCLHWQLPGVTFWWVKMVWSTLSMPW